MLPPPGILRPVVCFWWWGFFLGSCRGGLSVFGPNVRGFFGVGFFFMWRLCVEPFSGVFFGGGTAHFLWLADSVPWGQGFYLPCCPKMWAGHQAHHCPPPSLIWDGFRWKSGWIIPCGQGFLPYCPKIVGWTTSPPLSFPVPVLGRVQVEIGVGVILELRGSADLSQRGVVQGALPEKMDSTANFF